MDGSYEKTNNFWIPEETREKEREHVSQTVSCVLNLGLLNVINDS